MLGVLPKPLNIKRTNCVNNTITREGPGKLNKLCSRLRRFGGEVFDLLHAVQISKDRTIDASLIHAKIVKILEHNKPGRYITM